ncbi:MAG: DUF2341 domain-containing protein, partial [Elusimicrobia bacterium]|nr:DUF2341 domain-containing protein [Elusimicrobiota bacterium]
MKKNKLFYFTYFCLSIILFIFIFSTNIYSATWTETTASDFGDGYLVQVDTWSVPTSVQIASTTTNWYDIRWSYRKAITITNSTATLVNYQVWIGTGTGSNQIDAIGADLDAKLQDDYDDIRFTDSDGKTLFNYWISPSTATKTTPTGFWIKISSIPETPAAKTIYFYYGNTSAAGVSSFDSTMQKISTVTVFNSGDNRIAGVWHFDEGSGTANDSSPNGNNGTIHEATWEGSEGSQYGGTSTATIKSSGNCLRFDGYNDYIDCGNNASLNVGISFTLTAWVKPSNTLAYRAILGRRTGYSSGYGYLMGAEVGGGYHINIGGGSNHSAGYANNAALVTANTWQMVTITYSSGSFGGGSYGQYLYYYNGSCFDHEDNTDQVVITSCVYSGTDKLAIGDGDATTTGTPFLGLIDEAAIYTAKLSTGEIKAIYYRQMYVASPPTVSVGSEQNLYYSTGSYASHRENTGSNVTQIDSVSFSSAGVIGGTLSMQVRASNTSFNIGDATPVWEDVSNGGDPTAVGQYIQYRSTFTTLTSTTTPVLYDVTINYTSDTTAPAAVTNLTSLYNYGDQITLRWTTPGDNDVTGTLQVGSQFDIQYSTYVVSWATYAVVGATNVYISTSGVNPGQYCYKTIAGLMAGTSSYFRIWTADDVSNWSAVSNACTAYLALSPISAPELYYPSTAVWTNADKFDWSSVTNATSYYMQIDDDINFGSLNFSYEGVPSSAIVSGLQENIQYYWHAKSKDSSSNYSSWSSTRSFRLDTTPAVFSNPQVKLTTGPWVANTSTAYVNVSTPQIQINVQDANYSGLRVGQTETIASSGCVFLMHLNGSATDSSGYGCDGTAINGAAWANTPTWKTTGGTEDMLYCDGTDDGVICGTNTIIGLDNAFTVSAWVKQVTRKDWPAIVAIPRFGAIASLHSIFLGTKSNTGEPDFSAGRIGVISDDIVYGPTAIPLGKWTHLVGTFDGSYLKLYKDGVVCGTSTISGTLCISTFSVRMGRSLSGNYFNGYIDEVGIWNRALSPEEIAVMYNSCAVKYSTTAWVNGYGIITSTSTEPLVLTTGSDGTTSLQFSTATAIPLIHNSSAFGTLSKNQVQFLARDEAGNLAVSDSYTINVDTVPPSAITSLTGLASGSNINLYWVSPGTDGTIDAISNGQFLIRRATWSVIPSNSKWGFGYETTLPHGIAEEVRIDTATTSSLPQLSYCANTFTNLTNDTTHFFRIWTRDIAGNWSSLSNACTVYIQPSPTLYCPSTAPWTNANICDWSDISGAIGYYLEIDDDINFGSPVGGFGDVTPSSAVITSLSENTQYYWHVKTKYSANNYGAWSSTRSFKLDTTPAVFSNPQVKLSTETWAANTAYVNVSTPQIQVSVQDENYSGLIVGKTELVASSGCVLLMHFNGNTTDSSGYGNDGTITGNPDWQDISSWKTGANTESTLYFDGYNNEYVNCGKGSGLNEITNSMSVSLWVKWIRPFWSCQQIAIGRTNDFRFGAVASSLNWGVYASYGGVNKWAPAAVVSVSQNVWHHMVYTYDGATAKIYKDGLLAAQGSASGVLSVTNNLYIGLIQPATDYFGGYIDEVGIWKRALSPEEIAVMYNSCAVKYSTNAWTNSQIILSTTTEPTVFTTGSDGTTSLQFSTATAIPLIHNSSAFGTLSKNQVQFLARD